MSAPRHLDGGFLAPLDALAETPAPRWQRTIGWTVIVLVICTIAWSWVARVDIVSVAPGQVVPHGRSKVVQAAETATVTAIHVQEGQHVVAGQLLIELDDTAATADHARLSAERLALLLDRERLGALLDARAAPFADAALASSDPGVARARARLEQQRAEMHAHDAELAEKEREQRAQRAAAAVQVTHLARSLPLVTEAAQAFRELAERGHVPRMQWLSAERERLSVAHELAAQRARLSALEATLAALAARGAATRAARRAQFGAELADTERALQACDEGLRKTARRRALTVLRAPLAGTVQQLALHTVGGVVTAAQPLLVIVPEAARLDVEARIANRDVGFVAPGQRAVVKIETFDFTRYGVLEGTVRHVSRAAVPAPGAAPHYVAEIALAARPRTSLGKPLVLTPGMTVQVELRAGERRVADFVLSPLLRLRDEAARER
ncbi:MAG: HlyD family type I secretion periplasmic adaptor subunit [Gammaproteobacteria bacterium]